MAWLTGSLCRVFDRLLVATSYIAGIITVFMMLIITYDVVLRYFFNSPTMWVSDISTLGIPFITMLAAAWALQRESHIKIDLVLQHLNNRRAAFLQIINSIVALLVCLIFLWQGFEVTYEAYLWDEQLFRNLVIPKVYLLWIFPVGALLLCIQFIRRISFFFNEFRNNKAKSE